MDREEIDRSLETANGEAMFASLVLTAIIRLLIQNGALTDDQVLLAADSVSLVLEYQRATAPNSTGAIDHARARLETLIALFSIKPS